MLQVILALLIALSSSQTAIKAYEVREANNEAKQTQVVGQPVKPEVKKEVKKQPKEKTEMKVKIEQVKTDTYKWETYEITSFTAGPESTGKRPGDKGYGITASGKRVQEGRTIAADTRVLPMGTKVYIEGVGYRTVEDTGSAIKGHRIDVYIEDLNRALEFGRKKNVRVRVVSYSNK